MEFREGERCCECTGVDSVDAVGKLVVADFICESVKVEGEFASNLSYIECIDDASLFAYSLKVEPPSCGAAFGLLMGMISTVFRDRSFEGGRLLCVV